MKTYEILIDGLKTNDYIKGRISGAINILVGMPEKAYPWRVEADGRDWFARFDANVEQKNAVIEWIEKCYPEAFMGVKEIG